MQESKWFQQRHASTRAGALRLVRPVAGVIIFAGTLALTAFCFWFFFHDEARNNRLRRRGQAAAATILEVSETGITVQGNYPLANLRLRVEPAGGEPYEVTTKCLMNRLEIPAYRPGRRISVLVDPRNPPQGRGDVGRPRYATPHGRRQRAPRVRTGGRTGS